MQHSENAHTSHTLVTQTCNLVEAFGGKVASSKILEEKKGIKSFKTSWT